MAHQAYRIEETRAGDPGRERLERFVAERFAAVHGARVSRFMPALLGLQDWRGTLRCALGYRAGAGGALFLEQYLDRPIELAIRDACRDIWRAGAAPMPAPASIDRERIVEVGHLAGRGCRAALHLVAQLPRYLVDRGYEWIGFTATARVRDVLATFDAPLLDLGPADPVRLRGGDDDWGRYYDAQPRVMAADSTFKGHTGDATTATPTRARRLRNGSTGVDARLRHGPDQPASRVDPAGSTPLTPSFPACPAPILH